MSRSKLAARAAVGLLLLLGLYTAQLSSELTSEQRHRADADEAAAEAEARAAALAVRVATLAAQAEQYLLQAGEASQQVEEASARIGQLEDATLKAQVRHAAGT